ncbi:MULTISPECIES: ead/Ea22-like family protein [Enterobacteriaceae]|uniref:ead/Ea22-like family protein n=1 Tax=Enterobacteriaceae TaxID=543 RepID=UPI000D012D46|nr:MULTISPECIES: ead/Ea22-like family protein [Enterobacteriaceae]MBY0722254.1 ead/Ea22-like family protein [Escherichia sp. M608]MCC4203139.1 ead/Ea22-like family protein [Escherichia coli]MCE3729972.1 ead/Ea22-like family protein [Escherichia coli]MCH7057877.1 ead/Ea22-like family protein [Escherichia coli]UMU43855.1 ead/Ea22-like family protein [Shigella flexneri]
MSEINYQALREAAEKATPGNWWIDSHGHAMVSFVGNDVLEVFTTDNKRAAVRHEDTGNLSRWRNDNDATFIATADPATVLALLDELEAAEKRIAELEAREIKPAKGEVLVVVSGFTGCGKSAIAGEIEIAMKAIGVPVKWTNGDAEKRMTGADWLTAIEMYKPTVRIVEVNVPCVAGICIKGDAGEQNDEKP